MVRIHMEINKTLQNLKFSTVTFCEIEHEIIYNINKINPI